MRPLLIHADKELQEDLAAKDQLDLFPGSGAEGAQGGAALSDEDRFAVLSRVQNFTGFCEGNDPYGEHDFGSLALPNIEKVFWKIDYYNLTLAGGSEDPADPMKTRRVLTIMLASEY